MSVRIEEGELDDYEGELDEGEGEGSWVWEGELYEGVG